MRRNTPALFTLSAAVCVAFVQAALAQDTAPQTPPNAAPNAGTPANVQEIPKSRADARPGQPYQVSVHGDWTVRCARVEQAKFDPCEIHQILLNPEGSPTAEVNIFPLDRPGQPEVVAGGSLVTPLETLLPGNVTLIVDEGEPAVYPFTFCSRAGCVAQVGYTADDMAAFRAGIAATMVIYPVAAPNQPFNLTLSLTGFTAAYDALLALPRPE